MNQFRRETFIHLLAQIHSEAVYRGTGQGTCFADTGGSMSAFLSATDNTPARTRNWGSLIEVAAAEVFQMMLNCDLTPASLDRPRVADVTAVVGLAGQLCGVFSIRCSSQAAVLMTAAMLGISPEAVDQETWDAVGEVCNMVAGNFKTKLEGVGDRCMLSVPTVVCGADYIVRSLANGQRVERAFLFQAEPIWITLDTEG
jgi:chemotaxis protein CheX